MGAIVKSEVPPATGEALYLSFVLNEELLAIDIRGVKEIIGYDQLTAVPMMPDYLRGLINLRGSAVPVIDLACRLGQAKTEAGWRTCIVVIEAQVASERIDVGILVDAVSEVLEIRADQIEAPPALGARIRTDFMHGMGRLGEGFIVILDIDRVLALEDLAVLEQVASAGKT